MRIISGKFKGSQIKFLKNLSTRPLKDSVKENIFNILLHSNNFKIKISQANVLDLYQEKCKVRGMGVEERKEFYAGKKLYSSEMGGQHDSADFYFRSEADVLAFVAACGKSQD